MDKSDTASLLDRLGAKDVTYLDFEASPMPNAAGGPGWMIIDSVAAHDPLHSWTEMDAHRKQQQLHLADKLNSRRGHAPERSPFQAPAIEASSREQQHRQPRALFGANENSQTSS